MSEKIEKISFRVSYIFLNPFLILLYETAVIYLTYERINISSFHIRNYKFEIFQNKKYFLRKFQF